MLPTGAATLSETADGEAFKRVISLRANAVIIKGALDATIQNLVNRRVVLPRWNSCLGVRKTFDPSLAVTPEKVYLAWIEFEVTRRLVMLICLWRRLRT